MSISESDTRMRRLSLLFTTVVIALTATFAAAQETPPAPQFLYRDGSRLVLVNGYTGEAEELAIEAANGDVFTWSPDGEYLLAQLRTPDEPGFCINLFVVDEGQWRYDAPIACTGWEAVFTSDSDQLVFSTKGENWNNEILWLYTLEDGTREEIYTTTNGYDLQRMGISEVRFSPSERFLTFVEYIRISGGTLNSLGIMDFSARTHVMVAAPEPYYAYYEPIWSENEDWFLVVMKDEYITGGAIAVTNHQGDLYLANPRTGETYRITYTPASEEYARWTADDRFVIEISVHQVQQVEFSLRDAMNVSPIPEEQIVTPVPIDETEFFSNISNVQMSPDPRIGLWMQSSMSGVNGQDWQLELKIGQIDPDVLGSEQAVFSLVVPDTESRQDAYGNARLIGWRPTDYVYPQG